MTTATSMDWNELLAESTPDRGALRRAFEQLVDASRQDREAALRALFATEIALPPQRLRGALSAHFAAWMDMAPARAAVLGLDYDAVMSAAPPIQRDRASAALHDLLPALAADQRERLMGWVPSVAEAEAARTLPAPPPPHITGWRRWFRGSR